MQTFDRNAAFPSGRVVSLADKLIEPTWAPFDFPGPCERTSIVAGFEV